MAKKLFGKKKKKAAEPAADAKGPVVTPLDNLPADADLRKRTGRLRSAAPDMATILGYDPRISGMLGQ